MLRATSKFLLTKGVRVGDKTAPILLKSISLEISAGKAFFSLVCKEDIIVPVIGLDNLVCTIPDKLLVIS